MRSSVTMKESHQIHKEDDCFTPENLVIWVDQKNNKGTLIDIEEMI